MIFSHFQQLAQPTWLRRAQVDEPKPRPSVPGPDQLKLDKTGTTSRKMHPTITQQCFFFNITSRDGAPPNLSVRMGRARLAPLALPRFRPAIHLGLEDLKTTRYYKASRASVSIRDSSEMSASAESLDSSTCPANNCFILFLHWAGSMAEKGLGSLCMPCWGLT